MWQTKPFTDVFRDATSGNVKISSSDYLAEGAFPIVDQGKKTIAGYHNDSSSLVKSPIPVVIFGDHTRAIKYIDFPFSLGADGTKILVPKVKADIKYLYHYLKSHPLKSAGYSRHFKFLKELKIPFPPLVEQKRIAAILDKADALRRLRQDSIDLTEQLIQSVFIDMFGDPVSNPKGWPTKSLVESCAISSGGTPSKKRADYWEGSFPWFTPKDLKQDYLHDSIDHISEAVTTETRIKAYPSNTVLIVVRGMILAHSFPVSTIKVRGAVNQDIKALKPNTGLSSEFLASCLKAQKAFILSKVSTAGHGTKKLDSRVFTEIPILMPPKELQEKFIDAVHQHTTILEDQRNGLLETNHLFDSLQQHAFRGELNTSSVIIEEDLEGLEEAAAKLDHLVNVSLPKTFAVDPASKTFTPPKKIESKLKQLDAKVKDGEPIEWNLDYFKYRILGTQRSAFNFNDLIEQAQQTFEELSLSAYEQVRAVIFVSVQPKRSTPALKQIFDKETKKIRLQLA